MGSQHLSSAAVNLIAARIFIVGLQLTETRALSAPNLRNLPVLALEDDAADIPTRPLAENVQEQIRVVVAAAVVVCRKVERIPLGVPIPLLQRLVINQRKARRVVFKTATVQ